MRIALMVVRIFFKAIVYFIQISYCGHSKKVTFEQTYRIIQNAAKNANRAGRVTERKISLKKMGLFSFQIIKECLMYLHFLQRRLGHLLLYLRRRQRICLL